MRKIKFRAWDNKSKEYFEPIYEAFKGKLLDLSIGLSGDLLRRTLQVPSEHESRFKDQYILEQFIGIRDSSGKDIYEGDILADGATVEWFDYLAWDSGGSAHSGFYCKNWFEYKEDGELSYGNGFNDVEVIGNIHENKDLLK